MKYIFTFLTSFLLNVIIFAQINHANGIRGGSFVMDGPGIVPIVTFNKSEIFYYYSTDLISPLKILSEKNIKINYMSNPVITSIVKKWYN